MTYDEAINWLFVQLPMYQKVGNKAYKTNLDNTYKLASYLNNPEKKFKSIHVAGTNGKGSTSHMLASVLQEAGYKVGLYTSPHLKDFRERIRINGKMMPQQNVVDFVEKNQAFFKENRLSFFEMTVGMAFHYFAYEKVDIAVIEVGLGGRLDSTNIISPEVSVITNIGLDHTQFLGNTLPEIAVEKAGIIKADVPCVIGKALEETKPVFERIALTKKTKLFYAETLENVGFEADLKGNYQQENIKTALTTISVLKQKEQWKITKENIKKGLGKVVTNTGLQGRWQVLNNEPLTVCDTAHNKEGLTFVLNQIKGLKKEQLHIVVGFVNDKKLSSILALFPKNAKYYFTKPDNQRGLLEIELMKSAAHFGLKGQVYTSVKEAFKAAKINAKNKDMIYVGGSTFVVAEIL